MIPRDGRGCDEDEREHHPRPEQLHDKKQELTDTERERRADQADNDGAKPACAGVVGSKCGADACKERQRVNGEREQQPAEKANGCDRRNDTEDDHGGGSRQKCSEG